MGKISDYEMILKRREMLKKAENIESSIPSKNSLTLKDSSEEKITEDDVYSALRGSKEARILKKENEVYEHKFQAYAFNSYIDDKNNTLTFIASVKSLSRYIEYIIAFDSVEDIDFLKKGGDVTIESDRIQPVKYLKINGTQFELYDSSKGERIHAIEKKVEKKNIVINSWIDNVSFIKAKSSIQKLSSAHITQSQLDELVSVIKAANDLNDIEKLNFIHTLRRKENLKMKDIFKIYKKIKP